MRIYFDPKPSKPNPKRKRCVELPDAAITLKRGRAENHCTVPFHFAFSGTDPMTQPCAIAQDTPPIALHDIAVLAQANHGKTTLSTACSNRKSSFGCTSKQLKVSLYYRSDKITPRRKNS